MNYIFEILKLSKCLSKKKELNISVNSAAYDQVYEYFLSIDNSREAKHNSREITKLYFLLMLLIGSSYKKIKKDDTGEEIIVPAREINLLDKDISYDSLSNYKFRTFKKSLIDNRFIECIVSRESIIINNSKQWLCKPTLYRLTNLNIEHNSSSIVNLKYCKVSNKIINILSIISSPIYINQSSLQFIDLQKDGGNLRVDKIKQPWSLDLFLSFYNRLWIKDLAGNFDTLRTTKMHAVDKGLREDNRIYTGFHTLDKTIRSRVYMDNEPLVECFDVHNCHATLINAILPDSIPGAEKDLYLSKTISGTFYEDVMNWVNSRFSSNWDRDFTKTAVNTYFNLSRKNIDKANKAKKSVHADAVCIDAYFSTLFPSIREFITTLPKTNKTYEKIAGKKKSEKTVYEIVDDVVKKKPTKKCTKDNNIVTLHDMLNVVETNIITNTICKDLYEKYDIHAISLHDGIFVKLSDCSRMPNVVKEFNELISYYSLIK